MAHYTYTNKDLIIHVATLPKYPRQCILIHYFNKITLASSNSALPDDGDYTETCWSRFNVNFNVNFKIVFKIIQLCISWWIKLWPCSELHQNVTDFLSVQNVFWIKTIRDKWQYPVESRSPLATAVQTQIHNTESLFSSICMSNLLMLCMKVVLFSAVTLNVRDPGPPQSSTQIIKAVPLLGLYKANLYTRTNVFQWWANHDKCWVIDRERER